MHMMHDDQAAGRDELPSYSISLILNTKNQLINKTIEEMNDGTMPWCEDKPTNQ
jgi:hypothetical protein